MDVEVSENQDTSPLGAALLAGNSCIDTVNQAGGRVEEGQLTRPALAAIRRLTPT